MTDTDESWPVLDTPPEQPSAAQAGRCPTCTYPVTAWAAFCEGCGAPLLPTEAAPPPAPSDTSGQTKRLGPEQPQRVCLECGGQVGPDGYCQTCGVLAPSPRDHVELEGADWVGAVSDRGISHHRNEDAVQVWVGADGRAVLVVCDGVSTSEDADAASLAAVSAASAALVDDPGLDLAAAVAAANAAIVEVTGPDVQNSPSATIALAVIEDQQVRIGHLGDSRVYWIGQDGPVLLTADDSVAQAFIAEGMPRAEAESMPSAHAITAWLGRDADHVVPHQAQFRIGTDGWLVVCSDGLWNYASEPEALAAQLAAATVPDSDPLAVARRLVDWANSQGGHDNITVALAHCRATLDTPSEN